jgi:hypothetical protein
MNERREQLLADLDSALERLSEALAAPKTDLNRRAVGGVARKDVGIGHVAT